MRRKTISASEKESRKGVEPRSKTPTLLVREGGGGSVLDVVEKGFTTFDKEDEDLVRDACRDVKGRTAKEIEVERRVGFEEEYI